MLKVTGEHRMSGGHYCVFDPRTGLLVDGGMSAYSARALRKRGNREGKPWRVGMSTRDKKAGDYIESFHKR